MVRSLLSVREFHTDSASCLGTIVALHGRGGDLDQLFPLCRAAAPQFDIVAAEAPRSMIPYTVEFTLDYKGYSWYPVQDGGRPEPVRFGDNLWYAEQLVIDVLERNSQPVFLLGCDEGAVLALNLAGTLPEFLAGVASIRGYLPEVPGWSLPATDVKGLPILMLGDATLNDIPEQMMPASAAELRKLAANVSFRMIPGIQSDLMAATSPLKAWLETHRNTRSIGKASGQPAIAT